MAVVDSYNYYSGNIPVIVSIESDKAEFVLIYKVSVSQISPNTEIVLDKIRDELVEKVKLGIGDITDPKKLDFVKEKFKKTIINLIRKYFPDISGRTLEFFTTYLMHKSFGLGKIELLMKDRDLEEIVINNSEEPVWVYHHKYGWLKTSILLKEQGLIKHYSSLIGRRVGRSITLLTPLLDATLETGDRVNATLNPISSKGDTITIRKFAAEPITITKFLQNKVLSFSTAALVWLGVEYETSILVSGGTASGKCVHGNTKILLGDGSIRKIKDIVEDNLEDPINIEDGLVSSPDNLEIYSINHKGKVEKSKLECVWKRQEKELLKLKTRSGKEILVTKEHPFFVMNNGYIKEIKAGNLKEKDRICCARTIPVKGSIKETNLMKKLQNNKELYVSIQDILTRDEINRIKNKKLNIPRINDWLNDERCISLSGLNEIIRLSGMDVIEIGARIKKIKSKTSSQWINIPSRFNKELAELLGYITGDGHLHKNGIRVSFTNIDKKLRSRVSQLFRDLFSVKTIDTKPKNTAETLFVHSSALSKFLSGYFNIPVGNKAGSVKAVEEIMTGTKEIQKHFIRSLFDCEAHVGKSSMEFSSKSIELTEQIRNILLRFGIISSIGTKIVKNKKYKRLFIYGINVKSYEEIGFNSDLKKEDLKNFSFKGHSNYDTIPNIGKFIKSLINSSGLTQKEISRRVGLSPRILRWYMSGGRNPNISSLLSISLALDGNISKGLKDRLKTIINSDLHYDEIVKIKKVSNKSGWVYDFSVENKNFITESGIIAHNTSLLNAVGEFFPPNQRIISVEDTRELELPKYLHWVPMLTRLPNVEGRGGITMLDLIINSLRMRPDRIMVGEIRRKEEAETLFEAMHTGHSVYATLHANSAKETVNRLTNPPIDVPKNLLPAIGMVLVMYRNRRTGVRRIFQVSEIKDDASPNVLLQYDVAQDKILAANESAKFMPEIEMHTGMTRNEINLDLRNKINILKWMVKKNITNLNEIGRVIATYYTNKEGLLDFIRKN